MKKTLLSILCLIATMIVMAQSTWLPKAQPGRFTKSPEVASAPASAAIRVPARADESSMWFSYCNGKIGSAIGVQGADTYLSGVMELSGPDLEALNGLDITSIKVGLGEVSSTDLKVFVSTDLDKTPDYIQSATIPTTKSQWHTINLTTPWRIDKTKTPALYIGYIYFAKKSAPFAAAVDDAITGNQKGAIMGLYQGTTAPTSLGSFEYSLINEQFGSVALQVQVTGKLPEYLPALNGLLIPSTVRVNESWAIDVNITNRGTKPLNEVNISYKVGDADMVTTTVTASDGGVASGETGNIAIPISASYCPKSGEYPVTITLHSINGYTIEGSLTTSVTATSATSIRKMVAEEATSNGCGFCPRGIVGMEYMAEKYPDAFIGIGVHCTGQGNDPMIIRSYNSLVGSVSGLPGAVINRNADFGSVDPSMDDLESIYLSYFDNTASLADIDLEARWWDEQQTRLIISSKTKFGLDIDNSRSSYRTAYVIREDSVGPYKQRNYFAGGAYGPCGGWENKSGTQSWLFNDVARYISAYNGDSGSLPTAIKEGEAYEYSHQVDLKSLQNYFNADIVIKNKNINIVGLVVNNNPRDILQAATIPYGKIKTTTVKSQTLEITYENDKGLREYMPLDSAIQLIGDASSGLPVTFSIISGDAATLDGDMITFHKEGSVTVKAVQPGNEQYHPVETTRIFAAKLSGVTLITADDLEGALYYDLQGMPVYVPQSGSIYIAVKSGRAFKVLIK